jgi:hypothetical protein
MGECDERGFILSDNARMRMQQRGISLDHLERLWDFGALHHRSGGQVLYFDRAARRRLAHSGDDGGEDHVGRDDKAFGIYAVIDGAVVVTVGHRYRNMRLH